MQDWVQSKQLPRPLSICCRNTNIAFATGQGTYALLEQRDMEALFQREEIDLKVLLNKKPFDYTQALDKFLETYDFEPADNLALSNEIVSHLK